MKKPFNVKKWYHFVLLPEVLYRQETIGPNAGKMMSNVGSLSFSSYTDKEGVFGRKGAAVQYVQSVDKGKDRGKYFTLSQAHNAIVVNDGDEDIYGKSMYDFIANSPWCQDSPNGKYVQDPNGDIVQLDVKYKLMDTEADAKVALDATLNRAKAQLSVVELDPQTLIEVAAIGIAIHGAPDDLMRHKVSEWAGRRPNDYFEVLNSGDRLLRAVVRTAVAKKVLREAGTLIYWNNELLGPTEDGAIKYLLEHPDMLAALQEAVNLRIENEPKPAVPTKKNKKPTKPNAN